MTPADRPSGLGWPLAMAFIRSPLAWAGNGIAIAAFRSEGAQVGIAAGVLWSSVTITVVNLICLCLLVWRDRVEGIDLVRSVGFERRRVVRDIGWGLLWSMLLYLLLVVGLFLTLLLLHGTAGFSRLDTLFVGDADFSFPVPRWLAYVSAFVFPVLNAPIEELHYRGYVQPRLIAASGRRRTGILIGAAGFGVQHTAFAMTPSSAVGFAVGFFCWGVGAGCIVERQRRLFPLIVAHFISNLSFGIVPLLVAQ